MLSTHRHIRGVVPHLKLRTIANDDSIVYTQRHGRMIATPTKCGQFLEIIRDRKECGRPLEQFALKVCAKPEANDIDFKFQRNIVQLKHLVGAQKLSLVNKDTGRVVGYQRINVACVGYNDCISF